MELKKEMYVRINTDMREICIDIGKIKQINQDTIYVEMDNKLPISFSKSEISKSSSNIIDLIQVGDYVNGYLVIEKDINNELRYIDLKDRNMKYVKYLDIKSILTKEKFSSMEYKIGE